MGGLQLAASAAPQLPAIGYSQQEGSTNVTSRETWGLLKMITYGASRGLQRPASAAPSSLLPQLPSR